MADFGDKMDLAARAAAQQPEGGKAARRSEPDPRLRQAAEDFEAVFLAQLLAPMFAGLETDGLFGGGSGEKVYRSMLVEEYGKAMAKHGGIGIADAVERELLKLQEVEE